MFWWWYCLWTCTSRALALATAQRTRTACGMRGNDSLQYCMCGTVFGGISVLLVMQTLGLLTPQAAPSAANCVQQNSAHEVQLKRLEAEVERVQRQADLQSRANKDLQQKLDLMQQQQQQQEEQQPPQQQQLQAHALVGAQPERPKRPFHCNRATGSLFYGFETGLEGWQQSASGRLRWGSVDASGLSQFRVYAGQRSVFPLPFGARDSAHDAMQLSSPTFCLGPAAKISFALAGGRCRGTARCDEQEVLGSDPLSVSSSPVGFQVRPRPPPLDLLLLMPVFV